MNKYQKLMDMKVSRRKFLAVIFSGAVITALLNRGVIAQSFLRDSTGRRLNFDSIANTGTIKAWGGLYNAPPTGWLLCDGTAVSRTTYADLFAITSTRFGVGDGSTTFNLPDLRSKFPRGAPNVTSGGGTGGATCHGHWGGTHTHPAESVQTDTKDFMLPIENDIHELSCTENANRYVKYSCCCNICPSHYHYGAVGTVTGLDGANTSSCSNIPPYQDVCWIIKT